MTLCTLCGAGFQFVGEHRPACAALAPNAEVDRLRQELAAEKREKLEWMSSSAKALEAGVAERAAHAETRATLAELVHVRADWYANATMKTPAEQAVLDAAHDLPDCVLDSLRELPERRAHEFVAAVIACRKDPA